MVGGITPLAGESNVAMYLFTETYWENMKPGVGKLSLSGDVEFFKTQPA